MSAGVFEEEFYVLCPTCRSLPLFVYFILSDVTGLHCDVKRDPSPVRSSCSHLYMEVPNGLITRTKRVFDLKGANVLWQLMAVCQGRRVKRVNHSL